MCFLASMHALSILENDVMVKKFVQKVCFLCYCRESVSPLTGVSFFVNNVPLSNIVELTD